MFYLASLILLLQIFDGGSTGSRLHVFEWEDGIVHRRGSSRTLIPLSAFGQNQTGVAEHLLPPLEYAATIVPLEYHASTKVYYQATAGMRLLSPDEQNAVYDALFEGLIADERFVFDLHRENIQTLSGDLEGLYGVLAANYLHGTLTASMEWKSGPIGSLDMGGSSTQIVFLPNGTVEEPQTCAWGDRAEECGSDDSIPEFFSTSYLSYGVNQIRERLWSSWVKRRRRNDDETCEAPLLENPCANPGYDVEFEGYTLVGTGNATACAEQVQRLIPHPHEEELDRLGTQVGGIEHPPIQGKFLAMSLFFFALDSLRELSHAEPDAHAALNAAWPTPSINELSDALDGLCRRSWTGDLEDIAHDAHAFTQADALPHRCFEAVYLVTLLRDGFGFDPEARDITFSFLVDGSEVEWTLGMALTLKAAEGQEEVESEIFMDDNETSTDDMKSWWEELSHHIFYAVSS